MPQGVRRKALLGCIPVGGGQSGVEPTNNLDLVQVGIMLLTAADRLDRITQ